MRVNSGRGIVRIAEVDEPGLRVTRRVDQQIEVRMQRRIHLSPDDRYAEKRGEVRWRLEGRFRDEHSAILRREAMHRSAQQLTGPAADYDVLGLHAMLPGDHVDEVVLRAHRI